MDRSTRTTWPASQRLGPLTIYSYYRVFLAAALVMLFIMNLDRAERLGSYRPDIFLLTSIGYFVVSLASSLLVRMLDGREHLQGAILVAIDIVALTVLAHASGGVLSTVAPLIVVTVAAGAILLPGRIALVVAATATLAMLYVQFHFALSRNLPLTSGSTQVGLLGFAFFGIAIAASQLTRRLQASEALATQRTQELNELENLNSHVIQRMRTGILVIDNQGTIRLANSAAQHMLSPDDWQPAVQLDAVSPELTQRIAAWLAEPSQRRPPFRNHAGGPEVDASMASVRLGDHRATLVFLEDMTSLSQHLQQMKLASLGRLTASIAHEIRNPLSAITHAAQLLDELPQLPADDRRLAEIIRQQALRLDRIVENVLRLSRRQTPRTDLLDLVPWLHQFRTDYLATHTPNDEIDIRAEAPSVQVRFDPNHLQQILQNLCDNGLRHGRALHGKGRVVLEVGTAAVTELPILRIIDNGPGIATENLANLFEPFFTTDARGTGLGLYIARELCEANRARLAYIPPAQSDADGRFQITFSHPRRIAN
ncbi:MAG: ATP-binding protein [Pseudomonadota bacterium]